MNVLSYFHTYKIEDITGIKTNISAEMYEHIELWANMLSGNAPWNDEAKPCGILNQIAGRLNNLVSREIGLEVKNESIEKPLQHLNANIDQIVEYIALMGGAVIRPIYAANKLQYEALPLGNYLPLEYDFDGTLKSAILLKNISDGKKHYILTEKHTFDGINHTVECKLYLNDNGHLRENSLQACEQTAAITPVYTWENCGRPMIVEIRNRAVNKIDGSRVPVAMIAGAESIIEKADRQFARMDWEQEAGEKIIFADRDIFAKRVKRNGETITTQLTPKLKKLIVSVDGDGSTESEKIKEYSPELRTAAQNDYLQQIFRRIELSLNIGKGTISDTESVQQTATQYSGGRQELYAIVDKIEDEIANKLHELAAIFAHMAAAYGIGPNDPDIIIKWNDDQTRKDIQQAKLTAMQEVNAGIKNKWEYRRDFYGEDEATAKANVPEPEAAESPFDLM